MLDFLGAVGGIVVINLALSGDNALVIGAAAAGLPSRQRWRALLLGGGGAVLLCLLFASATSFLLQLPLLQALGGLLLLIVALRLLLDRRRRQQEEHAKQVPTTPVGRVPANDTPSSHGLVSALLTILVADVTMSLDNVLAIGALARGDLPLLVVGLSLGGALVLAGSTVVTALIRRLAWLLDVAAVFLGWTAASMILDDLRLGPVLARLPWTHLAAPMTTIGIVLVADLLLRLR